MQDSGSILFSNLMTIRDGHIRHIRHIIEDYLDILFWMFQRDVPGMVAAGLRQPWTQVYFWPWNFPELISSHEPKLQKHEGFFSKQLVDWASSSSIFLISETNRNQMLRKSDYLT